MRMEWFLIWTNLNPLHPRMHCSKFGWNWKHFWRRRFLNFVNVFLLFRNYLLLEKSEALHLNKLESHSPKEFGWNWPSGSWEEVENRKSLQTDRQTDRQTDGQTDEQTDDGRKAIRKAHMSFRLRWANNTKPDTHAYDS